MTLTTKLRFYFRLNFLNTEIMNASDNAARKADLLRYEVSQISFH